MALGDGNWLDDPVVMFAGTDISAAVAKCRVHEQNVRIDHQHTSGRGGRRRSVSTHYEWSVELMLVGDGYLAASLDAVITAAMRPPLGTGAGTAAINIRPGSGSLGSANPSYSGTVCVDEWEPLGEDGTIPSEIVQTVELMGTGDMTKATS